MVQNVSLLHPISADRWLFQLENKGSNSYYCSSFPSFMSLFLNLVAFSRFLQSHLFSFSLLPPCRYWRYCYLYSPFSTKFCPPSSFLPLYHLSSHNRWFEAKVPPSASRRTASSPILLPFFSLFDTFFSFFFSPSSYSLSLFPTTTRQVTKERYLKEKRTSRIEEKELESLESRLEPELSVDRFPLSAHIRTKFKNIHRLRSATCRLQTELIRWDRTFFMFFFWSSMSFSLCLHGLFPKEGLTANTLETLLFDKCSTTLLVRKRSNNQGNWICERMKERNVLSNFEDKFYCLMKESCHYRQHCFPTTAGIWLKTEEKRENAVNVPLSRATRRLYESVSWTDGLSSGFSEIDPPTCIPCPNRWRAITWSGAWNASEGRLFPDVNVSFSFSNIPTPAVTKWIRISPGIPFRVRFNGQERKW